MQPTATTARSALNSFSGITGLLLLLAISGCGLALSNEDQLIRGEKALAEGDFRAAIIDSKDVLLDEPDNVRGRLLLGRASVEVGDGAAAEKELRRAIKLGAPMADKLDAHLGIVSSFVAEKNFMQARGRIDQILGTSPDNPRVWLYSGSFNSRVGDFETAEANFAVALRLTSAQGDESGRIMALAKLGRIDEARKNLDEILAGDDIFASRNDAEKLLAEL